MSAVLVKVSSVRQKGLTLVELMVALAISLLIVIAAASFFLNSSKTREMQEAVSLLQDNARYATEILTKSIQQTGYQNYAWGSSGASVRREVAAPSDGEPDIRGYNNSAAGTSLNNGTHNSSTNRVNNSDTLVIRYQGSGVASGDGSMIDCRGEPQAESSSLNARAYSIFEVRRDSATSEPELRCKYYNLKGKNQGFSTDRIVRGVETFQVMYGVDSDGDSYIDKWLNAAEVNPGGDTTALVDWAKVKSVRIGMVLRSPTRVTDAVPSALTLSPLGVNFTSGATDRLVGVNTTPVEGEYSSTDGRLRKVVTFTVNVRNPL